MPAHDTSQVNPAEDTEQYLWNRLKRETENERKRLVDISLIAVQETPWHKQHATQVVRSWGNRGLVFVYDNGAQAKLTRAGQETSTV